METPTLVKLVQDDLSGSGRADAGSHARSRQPWLGLPKTSRAKLSCRLQWLILLIFSLNAASSSAQLRVESPVTYDLAAMGIPNPQGIAYHPKRKTFFIVSKTPAQVFEVALEGTVLNSFDIGAVGRPEGIAYDPVSGDLLVCRGKPIIFQFRADGSPVDTALLIPYDADADGIAVHPLSGHIFIADDDAQMIYELDRMQRVLGSFSTSELAPGFSEPNGLAFYGSDLMITDDSTRSVYLVSTEGQLLQTIGRGETLEMKDPEGAAVIGQERACFISDSDAKLHCFDPPRQSLTVPFKVAFERSFVGFAAVNLGESITPINGWGYDDQGRNQAFAQTQPVPSKGQAALLTEELLRPAPNPQQAENGQLPAYDSDNVRTLVIEGQRGPLQGFFMVGDFNLEKLDGIGGKLNAADTLYFPIARSRPFESTILYLFNPHLSAQSGADIHLFDAQGQMLAETAVSIGPQGTINTSLAQLFALDAPVEEGYLEVISDHPVKGLEFHLQGENLAAVKAQTGTGAGELVAPHFFVTGQGSTTSLRLLNLLGAEAKVTVLAFGESGELIRERTLSLAGRQLIHSDLAELLELVPPDADTIQGYLRLRVGDGSEATSLVAIITYHGLNGSTLASLPLQEEGRLETVFAHVSQAQSLGAFQGLALLNLQPTSTTLTVQAYTRDGRLAKEVTLSIPGESRAIGLLSDPAFFGPSFEQVGGYLKILSQSPVFAFSLFGGPRYLSAVEGAELLNASN